MSKKPTIIKTQTVCQSRLFTVEAVELAFSNGETPTFERLTSNGYGAVVVIVMKDESTLLMVREYAAGIDRYELGFVKGRIDEGETPNQAGLREMKEEIGYGCRQLDLVKTMSTSPAYSDFTSYLMLARDLYEERLEGDEIEPLEIEEWSIHQIDELLDHDEVNDPRVICGLLLLQKLIKDEKIIG